MAISGGDGGGGSSSSSSSSSSSRDGVVYNAIEENYSILSLT